MKKKFERIDRYAPSYQAARNKQERIVSNATATGRYDGAELRPFDGRPGAMTLMSAPSRVGNQLFYRDGRIESWPA